MKVYNTVIEVSVASLQKDASFDSAVSDNSYIKDTLHQQTEQMQYC